MHRVLFEAVLLTRIRLDLKLFPDPAKLKIKSDLKKNSSHKTLGSFLKKYP